MKNGRGGGIRTPDPLLPNWIIKRNFKELAGAIGASGNAK